MVAIVRLMLAAAVIAVCTGASPPPTSVVATEARLSPFVDSVEALGTLRANESVTLSVSAVDTVSAIHFDDGDRVEKGKVLVEMTSKEEHAMLQEARATRGEALRQFQRIVSLEAQGLASKSLHDQRRREWEAAQARLEAIESRLSDRLIQAPFSGVLGLRNISLGALLEPGDLIATLDDDSLMKLDFSLPAIYLDVLKPGVTIAAETRTYPGREFRGEIKSMDSRIDPVTRSIVVRVMLPNPDHLLKPGMLMHLTLLMSPREAVVIPEEALLPQGSEQYVYVVDRADENRIIRRKVRIGARRTGEVEVLEGLSPGETVVTDGTIKVRPGQTVTIRALDNTGRPLRELLEDAPKDKAAQ